MYRRQLANQQRRNLLLESFLAPDSVEAARSEMETNYFGPLLLTRAFAPILAKNDGGVIVNVLSILSWIAVPDGGNLQRFQGRRLGFDQLVAECLARAGYASVECARWSDRHEYGERANASKGHACRCCSTSAAWDRSGRDEVLADDMTRQLKAGLSNDVGIYLNFDPERSLAAAS
jgi:short chain dehydrogenase